MKLNWAERWVVNNFSRAIQQRLEIAWMRKAHSIRPNTMALEVGCGRGVGADLIVKAFHPAGLHAFDLDIRMIRLAKTRDGRTPGEPVSFFVADAVRLPYGDAMFDAVFGFGFLHHVPQWQRALSEVSRVLKKGGAYFAEELYPSLYQNAVTKRILLHPKENRFQSGELKAQLDSVGLSIRRLLEHRLMGILAVAVKES